MSEKKYCFREANEEDFTRIAEFFRLHNYGLQKESWFHWKYRGNPHGPGRFFFVEDGAGSIKGTLGYIPQRILDEGKHSFLVMQAVDMFVAPDARGMKLASTLYRSTTEVLDSPLIGFPNISSQNLLLKEGWELAAPLDSWYFPTAVHAGFTGKARLFIPAFSAAYARVWLPHSGGAVKAKTVTRFNEKLDQIIRRDIGNRTTAYLNWRFSDNPVKGYHLFEHCNEGALLGYSVLQRDNSSAILYDFHFSKYPRSCFRTLVDFCASQRISRLVFRGIGHSLWRYGFFKRSPLISMITYKLPRISPLVTLTDSDW